MSTNKNILICPLEWGLGHAGRMVPLARKLQELNQNIFFGSGEEHLSFFKKEVTGATYVHFPGFRIKYSRFLPQYIVILLNAPALIYHSFSEHNKLKKIIRDYSIDIVISDNRIGLWKSGLTSVFITHQLRIKFPKPFRFLEFVGIQVVRSVIKKYTFCFVPDVDGELNVTGELAHGMNIPKNVRYIGLLSRLKGKRSDNNPDSDKFLVVLSGPEPQRTIFKQKMTEIFTTLKQPAVILEGKPEGTEEKDIIGNIEYINHPDEECTIKLLGKSRTIICRAGYTSIMELISVGRSALLIPTFGQTEQEYLAHHLSEKGWFNSIPQKDLGAEAVAGSIINKMPEGMMEKSRILLDKALTELLEE